MNDYREIIAFVKKYRNHIGIGIVVTAMLYSVFNRITVKKPSTQTSPQSSANSTPGREATPNSTADPSPGAAISPVASPTSVALTGGRFYDLDATKQTVYYYDELSGQLKRYSLANKSSEVIAEIGGIVERLAWSPDHTKVIVSSKVGDDGLSLAEQSNLDRQTTLHILDSKNTVQLNKNIVSVEFITNDRIIYHYRDAQFSNLSVADANGANWKNIGFVRQDILFRRVGETVLAQPSESKIVTRYDPSGKKLTDYTVPDQLYLDQSAWSTQVSSVYLAVTQGGIVVNRFTPGLPNQLIGAVPTQADPVILWDNVNSDVYVAGFDGLVRLDTKVGAQ